MFPVDSIKVGPLCQLSADPRSHSSNIFVQTRMQVFATSPAAVYTGIGNAFTRISATEGARALWRGVSSVILGAGPAHAVHFGTYEAIKEFAGGNVEGSSHQWIATCESPRVVLELLFIVRTTPIGRP